jgi:metal-responsive CopG/Arc/MetJ family transcriptional regulator
MATERPRFTITVSDELLQKIDDFRFENRYATRTQAVNELIRLGLKFLENSENPSNQSQRSGVEP